MSGIIPYSGPRDSAGTAINAGETLIDLHSHILFDLDDGACTLDEAVMMAKVAATDGIRIMAATPHSPASSACRDYHPGRIRERVGAFNAVLADEGVPIEVVSGTEIRCVADLAEQLTQGALLPYGTSKTILLELPDDALPPTLDAILFSVQLAGYRVVLAHPERIREIQRHPNRLLSLIERGVLMQLTAEALTGGQGEQMRTIAETLLTHGMIHVLASDAHGVSPRRPPQLAHARARAAELIGMDLASALVTTTPAGILAGTHIHLPPPQPVVRRQRRWWHLHIWQDESR